MASQARSDAIPAWFLQIASDATCEPGHRLRSAFEFGDGMAALKRDLAELVRSAGFTPGAKDVSPLLELLASDDDDQIRDVERALVRVGPTVVPLAIARA